jgi:hypothetical protein
MVQILPAKTSLGEHFGRSIGGNLQQGIQQGGDIAFQRGMLQDAFKNLENLPKDTTPFQLASELMKATAGIPGAERYVGQLYPLLLGQLRSEKAFGEGGEQNQVAGQVPAVNNEPGGILGSIIPQDQIAQQSQKYGQDTGTGIQGATEMQNFLIGKNQIALQQRALAEQKAADIGIKPEEMPAFMQLGQKNKNAKTLDDWVRETKKDYGTYKTLSKSLESASYPGFMRGLILGAGHRSERLKELDNTVNRLVNMGFEPEVREKLSSSGLSPAEVEERIHPFSKETQMELHKLPSPGPAFQSEESLSKKEEKVKDFLQKNVTNDTSLLALRDRLWQKGYNWERISKMMNESLDPNKLTTSQINELGILEREPPRQSLNYIFREIGNVFQTIRGEK